MEKLLDLRFVIGLFFLVIGVLLIIYAAISGSHGAQWINTRAGSLFTGFGLIMLVLSFKKRKRIR